MTEPKEFKSKFEEATSSDASTEEEAVETSDYTPRVIFTSDAKPDLSKMQIPQLRVAQGMTAEVASRKAQLGQYVLSNFPATDEVIIVPLIAQNMRIFKPVATEPAKCNAPTGTFGVGDPGGECAKCPLSKWGPKNEKTGKSFPPKCKEGIVVRAYSCTHKSIVDVQFMSRSVGKGEFIQTQAYAYGYGGFAIKMTTAQEKNDLGSWYVPEIEMLQDIPEDHKMAAAKWYDLFAANAQPTTAEALASLAAEISPAK